jgi:hypothetical protein
MREQNVKALSTLLEEASAATSGGYRLTTLTAGGTERLILDHPTRLAEWLVEAGAVLVPEAVTEQEAMNLLHRVPAERAPRVTELSEGPWLREGLRRIATDGGPRSRDEGDEALLALKGTHHWGVEG